MTIQDAIETQILQLAKHKITLNEEAYSALQEYCATENAKVLSDPEGDASDIPYGGQLDHFLTDWSDSQKTSTEFILLGYDLEQFMTVRDTVEKELKGGRIVGMIFNERQKVTVVAELTRAQKDACAYLFGMSNKPEWVK